MTLPELALRRSVFAAVLSILAVLVGLMALTRLSVREMPDVDQARLTVTVAWTGAAPDVVDSQVTALVEGAVAGVAGLSTLASEAERGRSRTVMTFDSGVDMDDAAMDVRAALDSIANDLPDEADAPQLRKNDTQSDPIARLSLRSDRMSAIDLSDYADRFISDRFARIEGVAAVSLTGERAPAMRVWLEPRRMAAHGITAADVVEAIGESNIELPAGELLTEGRQLQVLARTRLATPEEFAAVPLRSDGDRPVLLGDVARIERGAENEDQLNRSNLSTSLGLSITAQSQANAVLVSQEIQKEIEAVAPTLPEGMSLQLDSDEAAFVEAAIDSVVQVLFEAALLVVLVMVLFLGSLRAAIPPAVTIPISLLGAVAGMWFAGFTINTLTLFALVLAIGLVVDDAIVVIENIQRRIRLGESPLVAALRGGVQVNFAVIATTAVLIAVFLPISFMPGDMGKLFAEFGATMAISVAASSVVALTLAPALSAALLRRDEGWGERASGRITDALARGYAAVLARALDRPLLVLAPAAFLSCGAVAIYERLPAALTPSEDRGMLMVSITAPQGANLSVTDQATKQAEAVIRPYLDSGVVKAISTNVGSWGELRRARIILRLAPWEERSMTQDALAAALRPGFSRIGGAAVSLRMPGGFGGGGGGIDALIGGPDAQTAAEWAGLLAARLRQDPRFGEVEVDWGANQPAATVEIDRERAEDLGVSIQQAAQALQTFFASRTVTEYREGGRLRAVIVQAEPGERNQLEDLSSILVRGGSGDLIPVSAFAHIRSEATAPALERYDRAPSVPLSVDLAEGTAMGGAISAIREAAREVLPPQASVAWDGAAKRFVENQEGVNLVFLLALAIVFLALAAQFESWVDPFTIMLTAPLAVTGALGTLWWFDQSLNIYSQVGLVLLIGLTAKNGVLIVEFCNQLREEGAGLREATLEGAATRLRPVLMTTVATVLGALPMTWAEGAGAAARSSIGLVIVGGVSFSTLLTLFLTPVLYERFAPFTKVRTGRRETIDAALAGGPVAG